MRRNKTGRLNPEVVAESQLIDDARSGSRLALAKLLSQVENDREACSRIVAGLSQNLGHAYRVGFTGPPGAGKSSLVTAFTKLLRANGKKVGVLAVDPTSPFSGGALLGDRVRMMTLSADSDVFVRSLATRGDLGGLARAAGDMADVLDAFGFDFVLLETVGVGQSELEVAKHADTTVVVLVPESGDAIQGMKAGLMEIADVFIINKADREGAERFATDLRSAMHLKPWTGWTPPLVMTVATREEGIREFDGRIREHAQHLKATGEFERRREERLRRRVEKMVEDHLVKQFWNPDRKQEMERAIRQRRSPYEIALDLTGRGS